MEKGGTYKYVDIDGNKYAVKPEHMTSLRGNVLVPKTHGIIAMRGKLDSLLARTMEVQIVAEEDGRPEVAADLEDVAKLISTILMSEVGGMPVDSFTVFGMDEAELRRTSHNPKKYLGVDHMLPSYRMGKTFAAVNVLRAQSREAELHAAGVFTGADGKVEREDLLQAMNRLSSALYVLMCRLLAKQQSDG